MKITVIGSGAMGSLFGGYLSRYHEVSILDNNRERSMLLNQEGLVIEEPNGPVVVWPKSVTDALDAQEADMVLLCVKAYSSADALELAYPLISRDTVIVSFQNGYGNYETIRSVVSDCPIVMGTTQEAVTVLGPGHVRHAASGITFLGDMKDGAGHADMVSKVLSQAGFQVSVENRIRERIIKKLFVNVGINALTAISGQTNGAIAEEGPLKELAINLVNEAVEIMNHHGGSFFPEEEVRAMLGVAGKTASNRSSMLQDIERGRRTEIDYINGVIVELAKDCRLPAPYNHSVTNLIKSLENTGVKGEIK